MFQSEIHSIEYSALRTRKSFNVGIVYESKGVETEFYGQVNKFFKVKTEHNTYRVAHTTSFYRRGDTKVGNTPVIKRVNQTAEYKTKKIVSLTSISKKVIFYGPKADTSILDIPFHLSK